MNKITDLTLTLALIYETKDEVDRAYAAAEQEFKLKYAELIARRAKLKEQVDSFRDQILEEALQIEELPAPIQVQWRDTPTILEPSDLYEWSIENMMREFLKVDEKAVKEYIKGNGNIVDSSGVMLAGLQKKPVLVAGEKTLLTWLGEHRYNQNHSEE